MYGVRVAVLQYWLARQATVFKSHYFRPLPGPDSSLGLKRLSKVPETGGSFYSCVNGWTLLRTRISYRRPSGQLQIRLEEKENYYLHVTPSSTSLNQRN